MSLRPLRVLEWLGEGNFPYVPSQPYTQFLRAQQDLWEQRRTGVIPDTILITAHPPTITLGTRSLKEQLLHLHAIPRAWLNDEGHNVMKRAADLLEKKYAIALVETPRGGSIWYHDPGVLQLYWIAKLDTPHPAGITHFLAGLLAESLHALSLPAECVGRQPSSPDPAAFIGVWIDGQKIAAVALRVEQRVSTFGAALNISPDPQHLSLINPCGIEGIRTTALADRLGTKHDIASAMFLKAFYRTCGEKFELTPPPFS